MNQQIPSDKQTLFREEAIDALRMQSLGQITLVPGTSSRWLALTALLMIVGLGLLAVFGSYTRRTSVGGQVQSSEGLLKITAAQSGTVIEKYVRDGQIVASGAVLFVLSGDRLGSDSTSYQRTISVQIENRRHLLEEDIKRSSASELQEAEQLKRRLTSLRSEREQVIKLSQQLEARARTLEETFKRYEVLLKQDFVSKDEFLAKQNELNEMRIRQQNSNRDLLVLERDASATQKDLEALRSRYGNQRSELERGISNTKQEFSELEARRRVIVTAPVNGTVSLLQAELGQSVEAGRSLLQLVPTDSRLRVRLYVPSRAAGFVKIGEPVLLRVDAFPYQKYGQLTGKVESVSAAAMDSTELLTNALPGEAVFSVMVSLPEQLFSRSPEGSAPTQTLKLQAGMKVEADLLHENRRLYEWALEPLYAAKSRLDTH
jgi:membrane fusion protein